MTPRTGDKTVTTNPAMPTTKPETIKLPPFCNACTNKVQVQMLMYEHQTRIRVGEVQDKNVLSTMQSHSTALLMEKATL